MTTPRTRDTIRRVEPIPWRPGLAGEYPGQMSFIELGEARVPLVFCWCPPTPPGRPALLGSPKGEPQRSDDEAQRRVEFAEGFWIARHPVNQLQWRTIQGENPRQRGKGDLCPVDSVSWHDAQEFCKGTGLRLPTGAEWEYACRAGTTTPFGIGAGDSLNAQMANFVGDNPYGSSRSAFKWLDRQRAVPEGSFPPNAWGLHDMHGQVWEWCEDRIGDSSRVLRGGSWDSDGRYARSAYRGSYSPGFRDSDIGFRPCPSSTREPAKSRPGAERMPRSGAGSEARHERNDRPA